MEKIEENEEYERRGRGLSKDDRKKASKKDKYAESSESSDGVSESEDLEGFDSESKGTGKFS